MQKYSYLTPWFPISVLVFLTVFLILTYYGIVPSQQGLLDLVDGLYQAWGLPALFIGALLETIAYFGLYFPGAVLVLLSVIVSTGSLSMFVTISAVVALASAGGSAISYYAGIASRRQLQQTPAQGDTSWQWFVFGHWNLNALGLWFFKQGFDDKPLFPYIIISPLIMFPYGMIWCYILFNSRDFFASDRWVEIFIIVFIWMGVDVCLKYLRNK